MATPSTSAAPDPMVERLRAALGKRAFTEQKMFGGTCFMINGNMLIGTSKRGLLVRVGRAAHAATVALPHASPMEMGGRSMEGYVHVAAQGTAGEADLAGWLGRALAFVETLPPKVKPAKVAKRPA
ncbi:MAG: TfoX/Sxy family protein [Mesorhizobium sp.]|nr:TfoX family protein [bacterium M00.F.Ca.ET.205.01.1.1]TGU50761.1 TfoX family protein [bacterium M00.F.Ca.ET.152.01.1.1]TGV34252.1 TfoX family protein [Mesorhizobium sp. M00.F.Ca.ET.186.01.1.1]TGZ42080.1 TfoX family protein [bacterium M00.F.Ca.ET.162.01.1.1]TJW33990.1 MAG: TfoX/Sxy family protein [Mesorhizobium sp.]